LARFIVAIVKSWIDILLDDSTATGALVSLETTVATE